MHEHGAAMIAADRAEARGDAAGALRIVVQDLQRHSADPTFWRPGRLTRLLQLELLGPWLPRWATSRWILDQAAQHLDPRGRDRALRALRIAEETGGMREVCAGLDTFEARVKLMDHDWVHRQVLLYELGGLRAFLRHGAAADLVSGADQIWTWASAPLGAYRLVGASSHSSTWIDLGTGAEHRCLEVGGSALLDEGDRVIGRIVPIEAGSMFESAPLWVPRDVADRVAQGPADWLTAVRAGCSAGRAERVSTYRSEFPFLTDVDPSHQAVCAVSLLDESLLGGPSGERKTPDVVETGLTLIGTALADALPAREGVWRRPGPIVAATMLTPSVLLRLLERQRPEDVAKLQRLAEGLPEPAAAVCRDLAVLAASGA